MNNILTQQKPASYKLFLKCSLLATASLLAIFVAQPSTAQSQTQIAIGQNVSPNSGKPEIKFSIGPSGIYYFYGEKTLNGDPYMDIRGWMGGFESMLKINFNPTGVGVLLIPFDIAVYGGRRMRYTGLDDSPGSLDADPDKVATYGSRVMNADDMFLFSTRSLIGPSIPFLEHYRINVLSGIGYKYTRNRARDNSEYYRTNDLLYLPLAVQFQYSKGIFSVLTHLEYDVFLSARQTSFDYTRLALFNNPAGSEYAGTHVTMKQNAGHGARAFVELNIANFLITPFINYFWIVRSEEGIGIEVGKTTGHVYEASAGSVEPLNYTVEGGVKFGYQF